MALNTERVAMGIAAAIVFGLAAGPAAAYTVYVSNEKGNSITVHRQRHARGEGDHPGRPAPARHHADQGRQALLICASDEDTVQVLDVATGRSSGTCPPVPIPSSSTFIPREARSTSPTRTTI